ncbi:hypothetical protein UFOVP104_50 [uncultured Caudovirales phage]|uniref:Uncharacterized protein n=1 Tax=uncultured Caudovirales phage TaxID=2100421 RepID=A0A6J5L798_9CAUD|nr:hypothetical protein UFOVP104_50 [uncultured Caudovirales phage]CAB4134208.1 hypothetical protein UFOVP271_30 [uncultured Caudovirales phage]
MSIVINSEFVGKYSLNLNQYNIDKIDIYIEKYEKYYLSHLLGAELYALFIADLDINNIPQTSIYENIFNSFIIDYNSTVLSSNGIKEMLLGFIYYHITSDLIVNQTSIGGTKAKNENSTVMGKNASITTRFNEAIDTYKAIQCYILDNSVDYTTFNGQPIKYEYLF